MAPQLVIFDCDGVLVDSEPIAISIDAIVLEHFGISISEEEIIERFVGRSPPVLARFIESRLGRPLAEGWQKPFDALYKQAYEERLRPVDGIEEALAQISLATCVASSSDPEPLARKLKITGLYERFEGRVFSSIEVRRGKPAPDLFLHAARRMGTDPARCVVVEDSRHGVEAARRAGMEAVAYAGGVTGADKLRGPRTTVFANMRELPRLLDGHSGRPGFAEPVPSR